MIYVALLRGINVGGNNKIGMKQLKETFEQAGMQKVVTYINSGNIIFADDQERTDAHMEISELLEQAIAADFGLQIKVLLRNLEEMASVMQVLPSDWTNDDQAKSDVLFCGMKLTMSIFWRSCRLSQGSERSFIRLEHSCIRSAEMKPPEVA